MKHAFLDHHSQTESPIHHLDARAKIIVFFTFILIGVSFPPTPFLLFSLLAMTLIGIALFARLPLGHLLKKVLRLLSLLRDLRIVPTLALLLGNLDDKYLKSFDRRYRVKTSGFILLPTTSFDPARIRDAMQYAPAYGWAVRRLLKQLNMPHKLHFADLSRGLGRICILAAEYGSAKVPGVDLAPEFCATARENATNCRPPSGCLSPITILQMDVLDFCETTDDDVFFMFRPFSGKFLKLILDTLAPRARSRKKSLTIIYSERAAAPGNYASTIAPNPAFRHQCEAVFWGQAFHVFQCDGNPSGGAA